MNIARAAISAIEFIRMIPPTFRLVTTCCECVMALRVQGDSRLGQFKN
jgi:hypothetical protein